MYEYLKIIFFGTSYFSARHLDALLCSNHNIIGVFTKPDRSSVRGNKIMQSNVKILAEKYKLLVFQPNYLYQEENKYFLYDIRADIIVLVAYGLIFPKYIINMLGMKCINVHGSLLPRWRGAAPIQRSLWAGDRETGITIMQIHVGIDNGDIIYRIRCPIEYKDTGTILCWKLTEIGRKGMLATLKNIVQGEVTYEAQNEELVTYAEKITKEEAYLNWNISSVQLERCIRAFIKWPMSYLIIDKKPMKVLQAYVINDPIHVPPGTIIKSNKNGIQISTIIGSINITQFQQTGKYFLSAQEFLNHSRIEFLTPGKRLETLP